MLFFVLEQACLSVISLTPIWEAPRLLQPPRSILCSTEPGQCQPLCPPPRACHAVSIRGWSHLWQKAVGGEEGIPKQKLKTICFYASASSVSWRSRKKTRHDRRRDNYSSLHEYFPSCSDRVPSLSSDSFASYIPDKDTQIETQFLLKDFGIGIFQLQTWHKHIK